MKFLIVAHVLSAIIGIGPTYFGHVLMRKNQTPKQLQESLSIYKNLEYFPKIGGSLAVILGLVLYFVGDYGSFMQLWLLGSLILYVLIQIIVIGVVIPKTKKLSDWVIDPTNEAVEVLPEEQSHLHAQINKYLWLISLLGIILFVFMIIKP